MLDIMGLFNPMCLYVYLRLSSLSIYGRVNTLDGIQVLYLCHLGVENDIL